MISNILLTALLLSTQNLPTAQAIPLNPSPRTNNAIHPAPAAPPQAIFYDIPNTELTLYISDLWRRIDNQLGHDLLRHAIQEAQSSVTSGRGDLPLKPRCWAVERGGLRLEINGGGPKTELTPKQMSYEMLLEAVKGLETFFSEMQGAYHLLIFFVLPRGSTTFIDGYGFGRLMDLRAGVEQSGKSYTSGCFGDGGERPAELPVQVDRRMRDR